MRRPLHRRLALRGPLAAALLGLVAAILAPAAAPTTANAAPAGDILLADFETADALDGATLPAPELDSVRLSDRLASEGDQAMRLDTGAFESKAGRVFPRVWLNVGSTLPDVDWTARTYLHLGVSNTSVERIRMYVVVWDETGTYLIRSVWADPYEHHVFQIETAAIAEAGVDMDQLDRIQISTERSTNPKRMFVDDIRLTDRPADVPAERASVARDLVGLMELDQKLTTRSRALDQVRDRIRQTPKQPDQALADRADALEARLDGYRAQIPSVDDQVGKARTIWSELTDMRWEISRLSSLVDARAARPESPVGSAFADSMSRVYPRQLPCPCRYARTSELDMVRGEHESIQLVAVPYDRALADAKVQAQVSAGPSGSGSAGPSEALRVDVHPVVSLDISPPVRQRPATPTQFRPSIFRGWTPDPLQTARETVDVSKGDLQAFWVALETTPDTEAGVYQVDLTLTADGLTPQRSKVRVRVRDVEIAQEPKLRTAIGHDPEAYAEPYGVTDPAEIEQLIEEKYAFLGDYMIQGDNIYRSIYESGPPSVESLRRIEQEYGGLRQFNVWYFDPRLFDLDAPDTWAAQADRLFDRIEPYVEDYRAAGFVDEAYLYCCDESRAAHTEVITFVLERFQERFPDIEVLTTTIDDQMGRTTGLDGLIDRWVRDVPWYDPEIIAERHANGQEAWWYLHQANANPTPNVFVNYDPIQLRVLLGPMTHQADIDGFLYYRVDRWYGKGLVDDGPLSSWDPRTWGSWAGDGSLFYPGPDGPIPSIRLENMRDGLEDYNLLHALEQAVESAPEGTDPDLLAHAKELLGATDVVTDNYQYARQPEEYRTWRSDLAETVVALNSSP